MDEKLRHLEFNIEPITPFDVRNIIDKFEVSKSTGLDGIGPKLLKQCGDCITPAIASIINNSIQEGIFPDKLKEASVIPIFKSGDIDDPCNYRSISILNTLSKIFERHIALQLQYFFKKTGIIHKNQSGFRPNHSCQTALTHLIDTWLKSIDNGGYVGAVFLDLRKAFDMVDHTILLHKLKLYHFTSKALDFFESYLSNRTQLVKVENIKSKKMLVRSGVPQGSILGPLLFLIYINDLPLISSMSDIDLYADDSTLHNSSPSIVRIKSNLQYSLDIVSEWCNTNNMSLHPAKTKCMILSTNYKVKRILDMKLTLNGSVIERVNCQKILGVYVDETLSWHVHVKDVVKKLNSKLALFRRIAFFLTNEMKSLYYNAYILSAMDYCCNVWGSCHKSDLDKIIAIQKRAIKLITKSNAFDFDTDDKRRSFLSFKNRYKYHTALLVFKYNKGDCPSYFSELVTFANNKKYSLRSSKNKDLTIIKPKTNYLKQSFTYKAAQIWNSLPLDIKCNTNLHSFKQNLKLFLATH